MNKKEILENYLSKKQEIEQEYHHRMKKLDESLQKLLMQIKEENPKVNNIELGEEEEKYWRSMDITTFLKNSTIAESSPVRFRLSLFFNLSVEDDILGIRTVGDLLDLTEEQYYKLIGSWKGAFKHFRVGEKSFALLTDCIKSKNLKFSETEKRTLEAVPSGRDWYDYYFRVREKI